MAPIYTLDLLLRYYLKMLPKRLKGNIVLTDRYGSDIILMKNVPFWYKKFLYSLFPKPTISIFMYNTPQILYARRPEETLSDLAGQMNIFTKFKYTLSVKSTNLEQDTKRIKNFVFTKLLQKWY